MVRIDPFISSERSANWFSAFRLAEILSRPLFPFTHKYQFLPLPLVDNGTCNSECPQAFDSSKIMFSPSSTPVSPSRDEMNEDSTPKSAGFDFIAKHITPAPSPFAIQGSITVFTAKDIAKDHRWRWWQGYRKDRKVLGFETPGDKTLVPMVKKGPKRKRKDDD